MIRKIATAGALALVLITVGCARTLPVHQVNGAPIVTSTTNAPTLEQVRTAIISAAQSKRWRVQQIDDTHMVATVNVRRHQAVVDINYTATDYSITYKDSTALEYDGQNIHRNYNKWVKLLDDRISQNLNAL